MSASVALVLVVLLSAAGPAAARNDTTLAEAAERVRAAKMRDAALRSVDAAIALLEEESPTPRTQALQMLDHVAQHRVRADSEQLLRTEERERLQQGFREQLAAFARERAGELPPGWVDDVMTQEAARVGTTIDRLLAAKFDERYQEARQRAVRVQRGQLDEVLYPDAADIEALAGTPDSFVTMRAEAIDGVVATGNGRALVDEYVAAISSKSVLFEENEAVLETRVSRAIKEALVLLWRQLRLARRAEPEDARERSAIATQILDDLTRLAAEAERVSGTSYGVFPSAETFAVERADQLETTSFLNFLEAQLDTAAGCPALPPPRVLEQISASYTQVPPRLAAHEEQLQAALLASTRQGIVEDYATSVGDATARVALRRRLEEQLDSDPAVQQAFDAAFTTCLRAPLKQRRVELAQEELAAQDPGIADFSFELADGGLRWIEIHRLDAPGGPFPPADGLRMRMEEARAMYRAHRELLAGEAKDVLWRQKALTRDPERKASFVAQITADGDRSKERKAYWQEAYENSVLAAWGAVRTDELLKNDDGLPRHPHKYDRVFGPVSDIIEEIITLEYGKTTQIVTQVDASQSPAGQAAGQAATYEASTTEIAPTVGTAKNPVASGGAGGPATGPATGESPMEQEGGQLARAEGPSTQTSSGGGGGGPDCAALLERCSLANGVCYEALTACTNDPATCADGLARCRDMMEQCEQGRQPLVPEGQARYRIDEDAVSAPCLARIGFPVSTASQ